MTAREHPLILPPDRIVSIRRGEQTQLRRVVTVPWKGPRRAHPYEPYWCGEDGKLLFCDEYGDWHPAEDMLCTWQVGQRIWLKEPWCFASAWYPAATYAWKADYAPSDWLEHVRECSAPRGGLQRFDCMACGFPGRWERAVTMPRAAARIILELTEVRIERVQAITEEDARCEGHDAIKAKVPMARDAFSMDWDARQHGEEEPGRLWARDPWVWRLAFRRSS